MNFTAKKSSKNLYNQIVNKFVQIYNENEARQLTKMLMEDVIGISFEKIMIDEEITLDESDKNLLDEKIDLLMKYHPIQYVLGKAYFYGREFIVNPCVLIPRQETEELINEILIDNKRPNLKILDIGSGSGCIGITLALELENPMVTALDIDESALEVTLQNAKQHEVNMDSILDDILLKDQLPEQYDIIVSNPPYVTEMEKKYLLNNVLDHEPYKALFVPDDNPLLYYKRIVLLAKKYIKPRGKLYFEINENYGPEVAKICEDENFTHIKLVQDINGKDRILKAMID
ncbi:MAG: peptide chain release factor N(5)-glutamine methyltransferase [Cyclobacteriaceae bacterium]|nr:peptide chain release factor N(5)-glutamine methyltransferase [Cyclobacteriaceae bacterium]